MKISLQGKVRVSFEMEIRLKVKDRTNRTSVRYRSGEKKTYLDMEVVV